MRSARSVTARAADGIDSTREAWLFTRNISNHPSTSKAAPTRQGLRLAFGHDLALRSKASRWALRRRAASPTSLRTPPRGRARRGSAQSLAGLCARSAGWPPEPGLSGGRMASRPTPAAGG
jgi:hypothetical protein